MSAKVYIRPDFAGPDKGEGGIRRWVEAQRKYLPDLGCEVVDNIGRAELVAFHAGDMVDTRLPVVAHCHGLYNTAQQSWSKWAWMLNARVIENMRRATVVMATSEWVRLQLARGMNINADILYAGIEPIEWEPGENHGYVLWNKTRTDPVCDPGAMDMLAGMVPDVQFVSTFGERQGNVALTGKLPFIEAKEFIRNAGVYLATPKETFGIGTLEAMACAVPVLGWAWGGQLDIVKHRQMGYLAEPGNYRDLALGLRECLNHRDEWGQAAREHVLANFTWEKSMAHCRDIYERALNRGKASPKVSVIVTVYDLERYLPECLDSVLHQTSSDWECIIVNDCSPGNCEEIALAYAAKDPRFKYVKTPRNLYLAGARNYGILRSTGKYVIPLDADDMLGDKALDILSGFLDAQPGYGIAFGAMQVIEEGKQPFVSDWPPQFNYDYHIQRVQAHFNTLPYCSMYRREVWEQAGGYRERCSTAEDCDFWTRVTSFGARAYKVSTYPTLIYRNRADSMSKEHEWPDTTIWYPWTRNKKLMPFGSLGKTDNEISWPVRTYDDPLVSVIIPVGSKHQRLLSDALDSVLAQTDDRWECIVVNDVGKTLDMIMPPWVKVLETPNPSSGPAVARNIGIAASKGKFFVCLDADDYLMPAFIERTLLAQKEKGGYVYTDWWQVGQDGKAETKQSQDFEVMDLLFKGLGFTVTTLVPCEFWEQAGGFDTTTGGTGPGWEDWDFYFKLATMEICGTRLAEPLFVYRYWSGMRREEGYTKSPENARVLREKWHEWVAGKGKKLMTCRGCSKGGGGRASVPRPPASARQISNQTVQTAQAAAEGGVVLEYIGQSVGTRIYRGARTRHNYRFGSDPSHRKAVVYAVDAQALLALPEFRLVAEEQSGNGSSPEALRPLETRQNANRLEEVGMAV